MLAVAAAMGGRTVGAGYSVPPRCCTSVLVTAPLFCLWASSSASRYVGEGCWCLGLRSTLLPTLQMNRLSLMTSLAGAGQVRAFLNSSPPLPPRTFFSIVPGGFMLQILSAGFSFYWPFFWPPCTGCRERGLEPPSGAEALLLPLYFYLFLLLFFRLNFMSQLPYV